MMDDAMTFTGPRRIDPADYPAVAALWHQAWHDAHADLFPPGLVRQRTPDSFLGRLPGFAGDAWLVEDGEGPVAFAALEGTEVDQFFLARRARGTGLAGRLMDALEAILLSRGLKIAELDCSMGNERARRFYLSRGYVEIAAEERPVWMPDGLFATLPMHRLVKRLEP